MKKILVTGGAGFLGSHLTKRLLREGNKVTVVDNLYTGSLDNLQDVINNTNFEFVLHDVTLPLEMEVDEIYNLACPASPVHYQNAPIQTLKTSVYGAYNILELATHHGAKVLQASTSEVYGNPEIHPQVEEYWGKVNPIGIRACYDEGKRAAETLFFDYNRLFGTRTKVVRIFNTYGPNMDINDGRVVSNFIVQALRGQDITIYGDGTQTRSFCYVDDLIDALIKTMATDDLVTGPINLGNPSEFEMLEIAELIIELTGSQSQITHKPLPSDDPERRRPDISYAEEIINWKPTTFLDTGLEKTIAYFKKVI